MSLDLINKPSNIENMNKEEKHITMDFSKRKGEVVTSLCGIDTPCLGPGLSGPFCEECLFRYRQNGGWQA